MMNLSYDKCLFDYFHRSMMKLHPMKHKPIAIRQCCFALAMPAQGIQWVKSVNFCFSNKCCLTVIHCRFLKSISVMCMAKLTQHLAINHKTIAQRLRFPPSGASPFKIDAACVPFFRQHRN